MSSYGSSASSSGWKPGKNKTILTQKKPDGSNKSKSAASFAQSPGQGRSSGYGQDVKTSPKSSAPSAPKPPRKPISSATAASFVGKPYGGAGSTTSTETKKKAQAAAARITSPSDPSNKKYKGKYRGPDEFKGNMSKVLAWRKSGKPRNSDGSPKV